MYFLFLVVGAVVVSCFLLFLQPIVLGRAACVLFEVFSEYALVNEIEFSRNFLYAQIAVCKGLPDVCDDNLIDPLVGTSSALFFDQCREIADGEMLRIGIELRAALLLVVLEKQEDEVLEEEVAGGRRGAGLAVMALVAGQYFQNIGFCDATDLFQDEVSSVFVVQGTQFLLFAVQECCDMFKPLMFLGVGREEGMFGKINDFAGCDAFHDVGQYEVQVAFGNHSADVRTIVQEAEITGGRVKEDVALAQGEGAVMHLNRSPSGFASEEATRVCVRT